MLHLDERFPGKSIRVETADSGNTSERQKTVPWPIHRSHPRMIGLEFKCPHLVAPGNGVNWTQVLPLPL
jgi:hypothetical protein